MWVRPTFEKMKALSEAIEKISEAEMKKAQEKLEAIKKLARLKHELETANTKGSDPG